MIEFKNVNLSLNERLVLDKISFKVKKKSKIALIGEKGSGKNLVFKILTKVYNIDDEGENKNNFLKIFGKKIGNVKKSQIEENLEYLAEKPVLFSGTVRDNIDPNFKHSEIKIFSLFDEFKIIKLLKISKETNKFRKWEKIKNRELFYKKFLKFRIEKNECGLTMELIRALNIVNMVLEQKKIWLIEMNGLITFENNSKENFLKVVEMNDKLCAVVVTMENEGDLNLFDTVLKFQDGKVSEKTN